MRIRKDRSIQSGNAPVQSKTGIAREDYALYRCMVTDVLYADDPQNISKNSQNPEVLYNVVILGGHDSGQTLSFCRLASWLGGNDSFSERILTPSSKDISKIKLQDHDGDIVWVQFNQGHDAYPVIIALGKGISNTTAATKADGPRLLEIYNGLQRNINNKGELITTMFSGDVKDGRFVKNDDALITETWSKDETATTEFKSGLKIVSDGKNDSVTITTAGGVTTTIDGKNNSISIKAGETEILIDGASGKISLKGQMIDLGASVSDFVTKFNQLATAFQSHSHMYAPGPGSPTPTTPPIAPLLFSVGSQSVKVQD